MSNPYSACKTLREALERYTLYRDIRPDTMAWYRRIVNVYCSWAGGDVPLDQFNGPAISQFMADKQKAGRSSHYIRSTRNGLVALLRAIRDDGPCERVRTVKTKPLDPEAWTPEEVDKLVKACAVLPGDQCWRMQLAILVGYYSGLDSIDIRRLEQKDIEDDGTIVFRRSKTGKRVIVKIPAPLVALIRSRCPRGRCCFGITHSREWFRKLFAKVVQHAGLFGSFKKLRKTSGSNVERIAPGTGHRHLGNSRAIFERHYEAQRLTHGVPTMPPEIDLPELAETGVAHA